MDLRGVWGVYREWSRKSTLAGAALVAWGLSGASPSAYADFYSHPWLDHPASSGVFQADPSVGLTTSKSNYDASGSESIPSGLKSYTRVNADVAGTYGLTEPFSLFGRVEWSMVSTSVTSKDATSYGLGDQSLGASYQLFGGPEKSSFRLQLQADLPLYSISSARSDQTPALGDQSVDVTSGGFFRLWLSGGKTYEFTATLGAGFTWRSGGYASEVPWSLLAEYRPTHEGILFGAGAYGISSMGTDTRPRLGAPGNATSGSLMSEANAPSLAVARVELGYRFDPDLSLALQGAVSVFGKSAPKGNTLVLAAQIRFGSNSRDDGDPINQHPEQYRKSNKGFVEYIFDAKIVSTNDRLNLVKMNKGTESGVEVGQVYDLFKPNTDGSPGKAVARAVVKSAKGGEAVLSIKEYFREIWIEEGFIVKRPLQ